MKAEYIVKKLLVLIVFAGLLSCRSEIQPSKQLGSYTVTTYIVAGDTLYSRVRGTGGYRTVIDKIGIGYFFVTRERAGADYELLTYSYYREDLTPKLKREVKPYELSDYLTGFSLRQAEAGVTYEGRLRSGTEVFSERTVGGGGLYIPLKGLPGSPSATTTEKEVIIVATPSN